MSYVHSAIDAHSRLAFSEIHDDERGLTCAGLRPISGSVQAQRRGPFGVAPLRSRRDCFEYSLGLAGA